MWSLALLRQKNVLIVACIAVHFIQFLKDKWYTNQSNRNGYCVMCDL